MQSKLDLSSSLLSRFSAASVADLEAGNSKFKRTLQAEHSYLAQLLSYLSQKKKHWQTFEEEISNLGFFHT